MVFRNKGTSKAFEADAVTNEDDYDVSQLNNATELIGRDSSALSLNGKSLIVPDYGDVDDMSSLGTSKCTYRGDVGSTVEYIGGMKIIGKAEDFETELSAASAQENTSSSPNQNDRKYGISLPAGDEDEDVDQVKSFEEKKFGEEEEKNSGCLPLWITDAPLWLKLIIISSIALLVGALVLIAVGAKLSFEKQTSSSPQDQNPLSTTSPSGNPVDVKIQTEVPTIVDYEAESGPLDSTEYPNQPIVAVTSSPTIYPSFTPIEANSSEAEVQASAPTFAPSSAAPSVVPTSFSTQSPTLSTVNFFVMGGRFDGENIKTLANGLRSLPNMDGNTILFHLGDWNSPYATSCVEDSFITNVDIYQQSSVPVYFVPGDNEYNDCPNPSQALGFWNQYLLNFETKNWPDPSWDIVRQSPDYNENFTFLQSRILFVGINLVGGIVHNQEEWDARHEANLQWIDTTAAKYNGNYTTMVILAHADPAIEINQNFFRSFYPMVERYDEKVIFVHRNLGTDTWEKKTEFNSIPNLDVVAVEGSSWPPMWIQMDPMSGIYTIDQFSWHDEYIATGTLPPVP